MNGLNGLLCYRKKHAKALASWGFLGDIGFVDETTFPLHEKPAISGNNFLDRKKTYSMNAQKVCNATYEIIFFRTGQPGCCANLRAYNLTLLATHPNKAFGP